MSAASGAAWHEGFEVPGCHCGRQEKEGAIMEPYFRDKVNLERLDRIGLVFFIALVALGEILLLLSVFSGFIYAAKYDLLGALTAQGGTVAVMLVVALGTAAWMIAVLKLRDAAIAKGVPGGGLVLVGLYCSPLILGIYVIALPPLSQGAQRPIVVDKDGYPHG
jgi:NADH:ubiquinone oxidoreductase subunit H